MISLLESYASFCYPETLEPTNSLVNYLSVHPELRTPVGDISPFKHLNEWRQNFSLTGGGNVTIGKLQINKPIQVLGIHVTDTYNELAAGYNPNKQTVVGAQIGGVLYELKMADYTLVGPKIVNNEPVWNFISGCIKHMDQKSNYISFELIDKLAGLK